jgi:hypothetical protein
MKALNRLLPATCLLFNVALLRAQATQPPAPVSQSFEKLFPQAQNADWKDKSDHFAVFFLLAGKKCEAEFTSRGDWLNSQMPISLDSLPRPLMDSLKACKYADWTATGAYMFRFAKDPTQYHLVVTKADQGRKILCFSPEGQLMAVR